MGRSRKKRATNSRRVTLVLAGEKETIFEANTTFKNDATRPACIKSLMKATEGWLASSDPKLQLLDDLARASRVPVSQNILAAPTPNSKRIFPFLDHFPDEDPDDDILKSLNKEEKAFFMAQNGTARAELAALFRENATANTGTPLRFRVLRSKLPSELKIKILLKLEKQNETVTAGDSMKYNTWVETLLSVPLGEILTPKMHDSIQEAMSNAKEHLARVVYGHEKAKRAILERYHRWLVNPLAPHRPLALCGVPGNGKTTLIREGLSAIMGRPFALIALGGNADSSLLLGHGYTYEGSTPGRIIEHFIHSKCSNPIFYFDELDKCSSTPKGEEVINALVHFTDPAQSDCFRDRYIGCLDIDASHAFSVFSFNDASLISSVLLDRLQIVQTDSFDIKAQVQIASNHLVPQVLQERGLARDFVLFDQEALQDLAWKAENGGVRAIKSALEQCVDKVSLWADCGDDDFLKPLQPRDLRKTATGYEVKSHVHLLLDAPVDKSSSAFNMYI